jgi:hypothetical protein
MRAGPTSSVATGSKSAHKHEVQKVSLVELRSCKELSPWADQRRCFPWPIGPACIFLRLKLYTRRTKATATYHHQATSMIWPCESRWMSSMSESFRPSSWPSSSNSSSSSCPFDVDLESPSMSSMSLSGEEGRGIALTGFVFLAVGFRRLLVFHMMPLAALPQPPSSFVRQTGHGPSGNSPSCAFLILGLMRPIFNWLIIVSLWSGVAKAEKRQLPQLPSRQELV